jgi:HEAT repeat protein
LRAAVSALLAQGHPEARHYSIGTIWREIDLVRRRENSALANSTVAFQLVVNTVLGGKEGGKELQKFIKGLTDE